MLRGLIDLYCVASCFGLIAIGIAHPTVSTLSIDNSPQAIASSTPVRHQAAREAYQLTASSNDTAPDFRSGSNSSKPIPNLAYSACVHPGSPLNGQVPCVAYCRANDTECFRAASAEAKTCSPLWQDYMLTAEGSRAPGPGWSTITSIVDNTVPRFTTTFDVWTSFSKANVSFLVGVPTARGKLTTMTPVYALGSPVKSESLVTYPDINITFTTVTGATPDCKFTDVATAVVQTDCGRCTLNGGTVELYYWLDQATHLNDPPINTESMSSPLRSTVLNGTTLYSPSVYISFQTAFATNSCRRVGQAHTGTMLALRPEDVSTQVHVGGPVYQSGANRYGAMNYADLTGLPPAKVYESQPSCVMFGCATIYPSSYFPTLVIPPQMRALDSAWRDCDVGLDGL